MTTQTDEEILKSYNKNREHFTDTGTYKPKGASISKYGSCHLLELMSLARQDQDKISRQDEREKKVDAYCFKEAFEKGKQSTESHCPIHGAEERVLFEREIRQDEREKKIENLVKAIEEAFEKGRLQGAIERVKAGNGADCDCLERGLMSFCLHDMEAYFAKGAKDEREKHREGCCDCCEDHYADGVKDGIQNERERLSKGERCAECKTLEEALTHKHIHPTHVCTVQNCERERRVVEREKKERLRVAGLFKKIHLDYENKIEKLIMELEI